LILSHALQISLLLGYLRAASLLFEQTLLLQSPTLLAILFLAILGSTLLLISAPVALLIELLIICAIRIDASRLLTLRGVLLLASLPIAVLLILLLRALLF
jgi:hypothetical protein